MRSALALLLLSMLAATGQRDASANGRHALRSPDGRTVVTIETGAALRWSVSRGGRLIAGPSVASLTIDGRVLGRTAARAVRTSRADRLVPATFYARRSAVRDHYESLALDLADGLRVTFRAFDDGVAYRFETDMDGRVRVDDEEVALRFPGAPTAFVTFADCGKVSSKGLDCFHTSFEEPYTVQPLAALPLDRQAFTPALVDFGVGQPKILISESDLDDYPGLWLRAAPGGTGLDGIFPRYPIEEKVVGDEFPQAGVVTRGPHLAETSGRRAFPWRVFAIADRDADLPANDIVYRLGGETEPGDWSWLRGGKSQSEWLWDNILYGVPFESGLNTATYRHYLEFAARFGLGYLFFDAGWSKVTDPSALTPGLDVPRLIAEAREKDQRVALWTSSLAMARDLDRILDQLAGWGAAGVMVDFMDRDDQPMVNFYRRVVEAAASRRLFVNFHGAYKPTGLERRFPNAVTREGLIASEYFKWSTVLTPEYEVTLPFVRGAVGPMDYEPGHMRNATRESYRAIDRAMMSQGTRMHQAAMYLVYESPYSKMGGNVSDYEGEPQFTRFLAGIPTLWADTRVLDGRVGDYIVILRHAHDGSIWIGAMTDWEAREIPVSLSFLAPGAFDADIWQDGVNAHRHGADWVRTERQVTAGDTLTIRMAPGGGCVARLARSP